MFSKACLRSINKLSINSSLVIPLLHSLKSMRSCSITRSNSSRNKLLRVRFRSLQTWPTTKVLQATTTTAITTLARTATTTNISKHDNKISPLLGMNNPHEGIKGVARFAVLTVIVEGVVPNFRTRLAPTTTTACVSHLQLRTHGIRVLTWLRQITFPNLYSP